MSLVTSSQAANSHHSTACRNTLMVHFNHQLKLLLTDGDFRNAALYLFGNNSGALTEKFLDTAAALKKTAHSGHQWGSEEPPPKGSESQGWQPIQWSLWREPVLANLWQQSQKEHQKKWSAATRLHFNVFKGQGFFICSCAKHTNTSLKAFINTVNLSITCPRLAGLVAWLLPIKLGSTYTGQVDPPNCGWVLPRTDISPPPDLSASPDTVFSRGLDLHSVFSNNWNQAENKLPTSMV